MLNVYVSVILQDLDFNIKYGYHYFASLLTVFRLIYSWAIAIYRY